MQAAIASTVLPEPPGRVQFVYNSEVKAEDLAALRALGACDDDLPEPMSLEESLRRLEEFIGSFHDIRFRELTNEDLRREADLGRSRQTLPVTRVR